MKANELRLGNYIYEVGFSIQDGYPKGYKELGIIKNGKDIEFSAFKEPIPLTEEWLLKFGFKETNDNDFIGGLYTRGKDGFYINKETMSYCGIDYEGTIDDIVEINYVHELQNLYFALTKEELTMK